MSTQIFPSTSLPGLTFDIERTQEWYTDVQTAASGKETRISYWAASRYSWTLTFEFLRSSTSFGEFQTLWGFINARRGRYDSFLYRDDEDNTAIAASLGTGDSTNRDFQLVRRFGGSSAIYEPILAPVSSTANVVVTVAGSTISSTQYTIGTWGSSIPGVVHFSTFAPSNGSAVAANFTYYFPCRFDEDVATFNEFMSRLWENKKVVFKSIK